MFNVCLLVFFHSLKQTTTKGTKLHRNIFILNIQNDKIDLIIVVKKYSQNPVQPKG